MKTFKFFLTEVLNGGWDWNYNGHRVGAQAKIDLPGHEHHGKVGKIQRQHSVNYGVEVPNNPGKLHWFNASQLKTVH